MLLSLGLRVSWNNLTYLMTPDIVSGQHQQLSLLDPGSSTMGLLDPESSKLGLLDPLCSGLGLPGPRFVETRLVESLELLSLAKISHGV
jgi:hypothetical protein